MKRKTTKTGEQLGPKQPLAIDPSALERDRGGATDRAVPQEPAIAGPPRKLARLRLRRITLRPQ